jgi:hypothetical protein
MPLNNDVNESALGLFRLLMYHQSHLISLQYNAQAMYVQNDTQAFMERRFESEDYKYICQLTCIDESKELELVKKKTIIEHTQEKVNKCATARAARQEKTAKIAVRVKAVKLVFDKKKIGKLKGESLRDHLRAFQKAGAPNLQSMPVRKHVGNIKEGLIDLYNDGTWKPDISALF